MPLSVAVRIRPLNADEESAGGAVAWDFSEQSIQSIPVPASAPPTQFDGSPARRSSSDAQYQFNYVCGPEESTSKLYKNFVRRSVNAFCDGQNAGVLAFGETASGKTFSMLGDEFSPGIVLLAVSDVFHHIRSHATRDFWLRASYMEVLNEQVNCLLSGGRDLHVVDDPANPLLSLISGSAVTVVGARDEFVNSPREFVELLLRGDRHRAVEPTELNRHSSRSHTILRLTLQSKTRTSPATPSSSSTSVLSSPLAADQTQQTNTSSIESFGSAAASSAESATSSGDREACLFLVDLAGSESIAHLANEARRYECRFINKSLHCLERVIIKLASGDHHHIPYRDSNLTRILQSSLGGGAHTAVLCNVCPTAAHRNETHKTLRFGSFARQVVHAPRALQAGTDERALLLGYIRRVDELENRLKMCASFPYPSKKCAATDVIFVLCVFSVLQVSFETLQTRSIRPARQCAR